MNQNSYDAIFAEAKALALRKNADYGNENITSLGEEGVFVRMHDKVARLKQLVWNRKTGEVKTESVEDTYLDLLNYAIFALMLRRGTFESDKEEKALGFK